VAVASFGQSLATRWLLLIVVSATFSSLRTAEADEARFDVMIAAGETTTSTEQSGEWLLQALRQEGALMGDSLTEAEVRMLKTSVPSLFAGGLDREQFRGLNNKVVRLARSAMDRGKAARVPTVQARPKLRIPADWFSPLHGHFHQQLGLGPLRRASGRHDGQSIRR
jgi:hypothetical protein